VKVGVNGILVHFVVPRTGSACGLDELLDGGITANDVGPDTLLDPEEVLIIKGGKSVVAWDGVDLLADVATKVDDTRLGKRAIRLESDDEETDVIAFRVLLRDAFVNPLEASGVDVDLDHPRCIYLNTLEEGLLSPASIRVCRVVGLKAEDGCLASNQGALKLGVLVVVVVATPLSIRLETKGVQTTLRKDTLFRVFSTSVDGSKGVQGRGRQAHDTSRSDCCNGRRLFDSSPSSRADGLSLLGWSVLAGSSSHGGRSEES